jgi:pilus assembly protein CpaF
MQLRPSTGRLAELADAYKGRILAQEALLAELACTPRPALRQRLCDLVAGYLRQDRLILPRTEEAALLATVADDMAGYGPLEPLLQDPHLTEIMVNGPGEVFVEAGGRLFPVPVRFRDERHLRHIVQLMIAPLGRRLDDSAPMVDARLPDGSRVHAIIPPLSLRGTCLTIRRFRPEPWTLEALMERQALSPTMAAFLRAAVAARLNILIAGGTGSGKTSLLTALALAIPPGERLVTIEDMAELRLPRPNLVALEARPPGAEGRGEVTIRQLLRNALRMRPDRILVGEARGDEVLDMLQALNTGHPGSLTTVHANSPEDALARLESLALLAGTPVGLRTLREHLLGVIDLILYLARDPGGTRRVHAIAQLPGRGRPLKPTLLFRFDPAAGFQGPLAPSRWPHLLAEGE